MAAFGEQPSGTPIGTIDRETGEIKYGAYPRFTPIYAPTTRYPFDWEPIVRGIGGLVGLVLIVGLIWNLFFTGILDKNYAFCTSNLCDDVTRAKVQAEVNLAARPVQQIVVPGTAAVVLPPAPQIYVPQPVPHARPLNETHCVMRSDPQNGIEAGTPGFIYGGRCHLNPPGAQFEEARS